MMKNIKKCVFFLTMFNLFLHLNGFNNSSFNNLCTEFWDLDKPFPPKDQYDFFRHYVSKAKGPILEPMCGSGRYIIPYVKEGFNVDGFDASPSMFKTLVRKCKQRNISPNIKQEYLEQFPETKKYDLIFIPDTSFSMFTNAATIKKCLKKIYSLLKPNGIFVFDIQTIYCLDDNTGIWNGKIYTRPDGSILIEKKLNLPIENSLATLIMQYELINKGRTVKTETENFQLKVYHPTEMDNLLRDVGFKNIKKIKAYDHGFMPDEKDPYIIYECIK